MLDNKKKIILGILGTVVLLGILGAVVWRVGDLRTVLQRPKAAGEAGYCVDPNTTFHLICSNGACARKRGSGANLDGCTTVGASCGGTSCSTGCLLIGVCQAGTTNTACGTGGAACTDCTAQGKICSNKACITQPTGQCLPPSQTHLECINNACVRKIGAGSNTGGCTTAGASCGGTTTCTSPADCPDDKTCVNRECVTPSCVTLRAIGACEEYYYSSHICQIRNKTNGVSCIDTSSSVGIIAGGSCQTEGTATSVCRCTASSTCATGKTCQLYSGKTYGECSTTTSEVSSCWGNNGANGKCYDCDGNGVINELDFSCFKNRYGQSVN